jgi:terminal uridylyltransferase
MPGSNGQSYRQTQTQTHTAPQTRQDSGSATATRAPGYHAVPPPSQPHQGRNQPSGRGAPRPYGPKIPQRPRENAPLPFQGPARQIPAYHSRPQGSYQQQPRSYQPPRHENPTLQIKHLDDLIEELGPKVQMDADEVEKKEAFRERLEGILKRTVALFYSKYIADVSLIGFGSFSSGFAIPGSDMDLAMVADWKDFATLSETEGVQSRVVGEISRSLEEAVLRLRMGGRSLERTRVPILKVCQYPTEALYAALVEEREKWEKQITGEVPKKAVAMKAMSNTPATDASVAATSTTQTGPSSNGTKNTPNEGSQPRGRKPGAREKEVGPLDFPKQGVGIQCDINFTGQLLGIQNTHLLRCYSLTDHRVQPMVLLVKAWTKRRKINSTYSGTLSSYGWVLMVLHYLVNIAQPPVCPNLQLTGPYLKDLTQLAIFLNQPIISGYKVQFWRDEAAITRAAQAGELTKNMQSVAALLMGFFQYYSSHAGKDIAGKRLLRFHYVNDCLSLRTLGGIRTKLSKGWDAANTVEKPANTKVHVTNRYLIAIEDPFETEHNVGRTVSRLGLIKQEFQRSCRILTAIGTGVQPEGGIFDEVIENQAPQIPQTPQTPQSPQTPQAPQTPQVPQVPQAPQSLEEIYKADL